MMQTLQEKLQRMIDKQLLELKALTEKTTMMQTHPVKATVGESSTPSTSHKDVVAKDRTNTVLIPPGSIQFPASMIDVQIQVQHPVEVNLAQFPIDQLQMIQPQISGIKSLRIINRTRN